MNYADNGQVRGEVQKQVNRITKIAENSKVKGQADKNQKNKTKPGPKNKINTAVRKTGRGS